MKKTVVIASNNSHKAEEIRHALNIDGWEFITLKEAGIESDPVEDADTFEGNARIKAYSAHELSGMAVLADDSGLEVDALQGEPGVYSARYAGEDANDEANNDKLLRNLAGVTDRSARFRCALCFIDENGEETIADGSVEGFIGDAPRGSEGFGYDPLFFPDEYGGDKTFAEVPEDEKSLISHRGRALKVLKNKLLSSNTMVE